MSGREWSAYQLVDSERELRVSEHRFYVEQAKTRLLSQFANIEAEADQAESEHWERSGQSFDPDWHDHGDLADAARDHGVEFYQLLSEMHDRTRLSVVAGMYHHWDKTFRRFLVREFRWPKLVIGDNTRRALWKLDSAKLERLLEAIGLDLSALACYPRIDAMRLVVNVFKHGEGSHWTISSCATRSSCEQVLTDGTCSTTPTWRCRMFTSMTLLRLLNCSGVNCRLP